VRVRRHSKVEASTSERRRVPRRCVRLTDTAVYRRRGPLSLRRRGSNAVVYRRHGPSTTCGLPTWSWFRHRGRRSSANVRPMPRQGRGLPSWSPSFRRCGHRPSAVD